MSRKLFTFKLVLGLVATAAIYAFASGDFWLSGPRYKVIAYAEMTSETFAALSEKYLPAGESNLAAPTLAPEAGENPPKDRPKPETSVTSAKPVPSHKESMPPQGGKVFALKQQTENPDPQPISKISTSESQTAAIGGGSDPGSYYVQLSSVRDQARAKAEWNRLHDDYADLLNPRSHSIQEVEIPDKGIYYRVLVGPFLEQPEALELCRNLKSAGQDCLVLSTKIGSKTTL